jgi:diguanylate cyclase (GGDEF)-like protein/PAS domain S-box-containing protein
VTDSPLPDAELWDLLPAAVVCVAADGRAIAVNRSFSALTAISPADAAGGGWIAALAPDTRMAFFAALAGECDFHLRLSLVRGDGVHGWVDCAARWLPEARRYLCVLHDVSSARLNELSARSKAQQLRVVADNVPVLIASYDALTDTCLFANAAYARAFGHTEQSIIGLHFSQVVGEEAAREIAPHVDVVRSRHQKSHYIRRHTTPLGPRWIEVHLVPHFDDEGVLIACFVMVNDITRHREAEEALRESEERLAKFMQASVEGIAFHTAGHITDVNPPILALTGYTREELIGREAMAFIAPDHVARAREVMQHGAETTYEVAVIHKNGSRIPVEFIVRSMTRNGQKMRMTIVRDIRDREAARSRIHHLAHHDPLTGLPNRMAFMQHLDEAMAQARSTGAELALLFIDLDHFKRVNDSLGHLAGDSLLVRLGQRITAALRSTDRVARFGGDEFMVLLPGAERRDDVREVSAKLLAAVEVAMEVEGQAVSVTPSIGVAVFPQDGQTPAELIKNADTAMYIAKSRGRANVQFFDPAIAQRAFAALVLEGQLAQAVERGEFVLHYQPQVRATDGMPVGAEALIRWRHPERGLLSPHEFIPLAEERRLIVPIGAWVLREAARCARHWRDIGMPVQVAVNLSTLQFGTPGFVEGVARVLHEEGVAGELLELELTERMLMDDLPEVKRTLLRLKALGLHIAVDDFGTGYTQLGHLRDLPIDRMKIDRSFVQDLPGDRGAVAITRAIVMMAKSLGMSVVAEGVETEAQRAFLLELGCDVLQGDLVSRPLAPAEWEAWLRSATSASPGAASR